MAEPLVHLAALDLLSWLLVIAGLVLVIGWALAVVRSRSGAVGRSLRGDSRRVRSGGPLESIASDAEELAERLAAKADAHAARLEELIAEADQRLSKLEASLTPDCTRRPKTSCAKFQAIAEPKTRAAGLMDAPTGDMVSRKVYELADEGVPSVEIAKRLDQHLGKVELILALRDR